MPLVEMTAVVEGKDLDVKRVEQGIRRALEQEAKEIDKLYRQFYGTWKGTVEHGRPGGSRGIPSMIKKISTRGRDAYAEVSTRGRTDHFGNKKLLWLDDQTSHRWAVMGPGKSWQSKTAVGQIRSGHGQGRAMVTGKGAMKKPRPGIAARNISATIAKSRERKFQMAIDKAIDNATN